MAEHERLQKVLIDGAWIESAGRESFKAVNPQTGTELGEIYPVSPWPEVERALQAASAAAWRVRGWAGERFAAFLEAMLRGWRSGARNWWRWPMPRRRWPRRRGSRTSSCRGR